MDLLHGALILKTFIVLPQIFCLLFFVSAFIRVIRGENSFLFWFRTKASLRLSAHLGCIIFEFPAACQRPGCQGAGSG
jgi:hypothetical protein